MVDGLQVVMQGELLRLVRYVIWFLTVAVENAAFVD